MPSLDALRTREGLVGWGSGLWLWLEGGKVKKEREREGEKRSGAEEGVCMYALIQGYEIAKRITEREVKQRNERLIATQLAPGLS